MTTNHRKAVNTLTITIGSGACILVASGVWPAWLVTPLWTVWGTTFGASLMRVLDTRQGRAA